jgi:hypothetical protein
MVDTLGVYFPGYISLISTLYCIIYFIIIIQIFIYSLLIKKLKNIRIVIISNQHETAKVRKPVCPLLLWTVRLHELILLFPDIPYTVNYFYPYI